MSEQEVLDNLKSTIESNKVVLFMKGVPQAPQCGFSAATVQIVQAYDRPFKAVDILANPEIRQALPKYSNWPTFPQLFIDGKLIGGCDIIHELRDSGELDKLFQSAFENA